MPEDPDDAVAVLFTSAAQSWAPVDLYRLRAVLIAEHDGVDLAVAVSRVDELLALHA